MWSVSLATRGVISPSQSTSIATRGVEIIFFLEDAVEFPDFIRPEFTQLRLATDEAVSQFQRGARTSSTQIPREDIVRSNQQRDRIRQTTQRSTEVDQSHQQLTKPTITRQSKPTADAERQEGDDVTSTRPRSGKSITQTRQPSGGFTKT